MNKQIQYKEYTIHDLSELLHDKNPKGVLILEGNLKTWKDHDGSEGSLTKTWDEAIAYTSGVCDKLGIPYILATGQDFYGFQRISQFGSDDMRKILEEGITTRADLGLYIAGCLCCVESGRAFPGSSRSENPYLFDLRLLKNLFGLDRVFIASSQRGQNAPRGYVTNMPKDGYFLV